jgi:hypothetical protein
MPLAMPTLGRPNSATITPYHWETGEMAYRYGASSPTAGTVSQNRGYFVRFFVTAPYAVANAFVVNGATVNGNIDFGIYDTAGNRLVSTGLTAHSGTSTLQAVSMSYTLSPGEYYMAFGTSSATSTFLRWTQGTQVSRLAGYYTAASVIALPATVTFAAPQVNDIPVFGITRLATL